MENLYEVLQVAPSASSEELRKSYTKLILLYHPDKAQHQSANVSSHSQPSVVLVTDETIKDKDTSKSDQEIRSVDMFVKIDRAWKILSDPKLRAQFDDKWQERCLAQDLPIQDIVSFQDFDFDDNEHIFSYPCRCGSEYILSEMDSHLHYDIVCCETCSLTIKVEYSGS